MKQNSFKKVASLIFLVMICSCATSPLGRRQMMLMPDGQMDGMGAGAFDEMKKKTPIESSPSINAYVKCIAAPMTQIVGGGPWEIVVFKDASANAFALPGAKIGVHTGILSVAKTESQLAAVIGHEVGHVIAKHSNERVSEGMIAQLGLTAASLVVGKDNPKSGLIMGLLGVGAQYGVILPHSRTQESEADIIGLELMSKAGFDPRESVKLWQNMSAGNGKSPPEFMSTHPSHDTRINDLGANIPKFMPYYEQASKVKCSRPAGI